MGLVMARFYGACQRLQAASFKGTAALIIEALC